MTSLESLSLTSAERAGRSQRLRKLLEELDIPLSYYEKAIQRYESLLDWFKRPESTIRVFQPAVVPQGSFRLGTVIRPVTPDEEYDLDIVCHLLLLKKAQLTQRQLKELVGAEVRAYAKAKGIEAPVVERKRAWRLDYADGVNFHIDILPCIPESEATIRHLIDHHDVPAELAASAAALTCTSHRLYEVITNDWPTSNPIGYAIFFEHRMRDIAEVRRKQLVKEGQYEEMENVPVYALKTPLQRSIQLLKRHRDSMFSAHPELKPISMIITTLAARAYEGEADLGDALEGILLRMPDHVSKTKPRVANPVNPGEDFADKWAAKPELETNFWAWHKRACRDFRTIVVETRPDRLIKEAQEGLAVKLTEVRAREIIGASAAPSAMPVPIPTPHVVVRDGAKPWSSDRHRD